MFCAGGGLFGLLSKRSESSARFHSCSRLLGSVEESENLEAAIPPIACVRCGHRFSHSGDVEQLIKAHARTCGANIGVAKGESASRVPPKGPSKGAGKAVQLRPKIGADGEIEWQMTSGSSSTCVPSPSQACMKQNYKGCARRTSRNEGQENNLNANNRPSSSRIPCAALSPAQGVSKKVLGERHSVHRDQADKEVGMDEKHLRLHQQANHLFLSRNYAGAGEIYARLVEENATFSPVDASAAPQAGTDPHALLPSSREAIFRYAVCLASTSNRVLAASSGSNSDTGSGMVKSHQYALYLYHRCALLDPSNALIPCAHAKLLLSKQGQNPSSASATANDPETNNGSDDPSGLQSGNPGDEAKRVLLSALERMPGDDLLLRMLQAVDAGSQAITGTVVEVENDDFPGEFV